MYQGAITAPIHSPGGDSIPVPTNSTVEGEGITRTGRGSCNELCSNITWRCNRVNITSLSWYKSNCITD